MSIHNQSRGSLKCATKFFILMCVILNGALRFTCFTVTSKTNIKHVCIVAESEIMLYNAKARNRTLAVDDALCRHHHLLLSSTRTQHHSRRLQCSCKPCNVRKSRTTGPTARGVKKSRPTTTKFRQLSIPELEYIQKSACDEAKGFVAKYLPFGSVFGEKCYKQLIDTMPSDDDDDNEANETAEEAEQQIPSNSHQNVRRSLRFTGKGPAAAEGDSVVNGESDRLPPLSESPPFKPSTSHTSSKSPEKQRARTRRSRSRVHAEREEERVQLNELISSMADIVGEEPQELRNRLRSSFTTSSARTKRRFLKMFNHIINIAAIAVNPTTPDELKAAQAGQLKLSMKSLVSTEFDHMAEVYRAATENKVRTVQYAWMQ